MDLPIEYPVLSYRELASFIELVSPRLIGARIERVYVPSYPEHPDGFFKREWALDLYSMDGSHGGGKTTKHSILQISLRPQAAGFLLHEGQALRPGSLGTRSGFDLSLHKHLTGGKIRGLKSIPGDRVAILEIQNGGEHFELHLHLIPAKPFGVLIQDPQTLATLISATDQRDAYSTPLPRVVSPEIEAKIPYREERIKSIENYSALWVAAQHKNALDLRRSKLEQSGLQELKTIEKKIASLHQQFQESKNAPDWNQFGSLLQIHFYKRPIATQGFYKLLDYETNQEVLLPADPKLDLKAQLERYFHLAKRNKKRLSETEERIESLHEKKEKILSELKSVKAAKTVESLKLLEPKKEEAIKGKSRAKLSEFSGKQYQSKEGLIILSGRNVSENLELTFKIARGNDLWFHVKGKPGSHTVVILPPKRTASLETLLDAAEMCILHSGGKDWGKTEVDYTFRKYVKKIKNQTDVIYTNNKTLAVTPDLERMKRVFGGNENKI